MITAPLNILQSLNRLTGNQDFNRIVDWLNEQSANEVDCLLAASSTVFVHQQQGYVSALRDIQRLVTVAKQSPASLGQ